MELIELNEVQKVLEDLAKDIRENYKDVLADNDHIASRALVDSIRTEVRVDGSEYEITMTLRDYWKWVENDTRPHFPPMDAILKWIQVKPVIPRPGANGVIPTEKQLSFLIARKISIEGTTGTHDLQKTKDNVIPWYRDRISQALGHDMEYYIRKVITGKNN